jgi:hypothetical protein
MNFDKIFRTQIQNSFFKNLMDKILLYLHIFPVLELLEVTLELGQGGTVGTVQSSIRNIILIQG